MKKLLSVLLLTLPLLILPSKAHAWGCNPCCSVGPLKIDFGFNWHYNFKWGCNGQGACGPWYLYWPYEAHFATAAPLGGPCYPNWPAPGAAGGIGAPLPPGGMPMGQPMMAPPVRSPTSGLQPAGYSSQVPSYWYGQ